MACDVNAAMADAACYLCLDNKRLAGAGLVLLCQILQQLDPMASCDVVDLRDAAQPYEILGEKQMAAVMIHLLCSISNSLGGLGTAGVTEGSGNPVADPGVGAQIYLNTDDHSLWFWKDNPGTWIPLIV